MPKKPIDRPIEQFIVDIFTAIEAIKRYIKPIHNSDDLINNDMVFDAICRRCEIIGEAMNHMLDDQSLKPYINPNWREIVDFRNVVAHGYFGLNQEEIFRIVKIEIPQFESEMFSFIEKLPDTLYVELALADEQSKQKRSETVEYLEKLKRIIKKSLRRMQGLLRLHPSSVFYQPYL